MQFFRIGSYLNRLSGSLGNVGFHLMKEIHVGVAFVGIQIVDIRA